MHFINAAYPYLGKTVRQTEHVPAHGASLTDRGNASSAASIEARAVCSYCRV